VIRYFFTIRI